MAQFKNPYESHEHSCLALDLLYLYDSFLDSIEVVADMGCGRGLDVEWWATLETRDEPSEPRNYTVYAVDRDISKLEQGIASLPNVVPIQGNFEQRIIPRQVDLLWSHDAFQYAVNPLETLKVWNQTMNVNGMMILTVPQSVSYHHNRLVNRLNNNCYFSYNICNLMYMLAVNGFDCKDAYFYKNYNDPWLFAAVYKSNIAPMDPATTTWFNLAELGLLNDAVVQSLNVYGYVRQEDILCTWLDKNFYYIHE